MLLSPVRKLDNSLGRMVGHQGTAAGCIHDLTKSDQYNQWKTIICIF